jgi:hypothetical protein
MTEMDRYQDSVARQVELVESDLLSWYPDLQEAFSLRDWSEVARIYRAVATLADRLEEIDPQAYSRVLADADRERQAVILAPVGDLDTDDSEDPLP